MCPYGGPRVGVDAHALVRLGHLRGIPEPVLAIERDLRDPEMRRAP